MSYKYLLMPGRHQAVTKFQLARIEELFSSNVVERTAEVIWTVTSANHAGTRRNPISGSRRLGMIESIAAVSGLAAQVYRITNRFQVHQFAHFLIESVRLDSKGRITMTPENTLVLCSTKELAEQFKELGYTVDPLERTDDFSTQHHLKPWDVIEEIIKSGAQWRANAIVRDELHPACFDYCEKYGLGDDIVEIFQDPLIDSDDGDITTTRNYSVYRQAFEDGAKRKVADFAQFVQPGRILDVGCATGETLKILAQQEGMFESDFYGVEAARPLYQIAQQRKDAGEFGDANIFFYQRNIMRSSLFPNNSLDTIITMALTHEIESYLGREELIAFIKRMYAILAPGGVYINYDVVAPNDKERVVYVAFTDDDGDNPAELFPEIESAALPNFLASLSTKARFGRFVKDFRATEQDGIEVRYETVSGTEYAVLRYADLCDFLAKKDYLQSWPSEMHERFCFWEYSDWAAALQDVGFEIDKGSELKQNPWLIENRFRPAATVFELLNGELVPVEDPATNVLLVARKPA